MKQCKAVCLHTVFISHHNIYIIYYNNGLSTYFFVWVSDSDLTVLPHWNECFFLDLCQY